MSINFSKMHGIGNDYIYINCFETNIASPHELAIQLSDRHFGIGGDGIVLILPSAVADCKMRMFNADGSEGKMCGNAIRCVGKYLYDFKMVKNDIVTIDTLSGIKTLTLQIQDNIVTAATVNMGQPITVSSLIPVNSCNETFINQPIPVNNNTYCITCVSMGNPHAVIFTSDIDNLNLSDIGPYFENHPLFPDRINTEFVEIIDSTHLKMRVWERGSGETLACGTGACAVVVAAVLNGIVKQDSDTTVLLKGGNLIINYSSDGNVYMTGPATYVFEGKIN